MDSWGPSRRSKSSVVELDRDRAELLSSLQSLWRSKEYTDLVVECQKKRFDVHKAIVCPRSTFLAERCRAANSSVRCRASLSRTLCSSADIEGAHPNQQKTTILMNDEEPQAVERCLEYYYALDYPSVIDVVPDEPAPVWPTSEDDVARSSEASPAPWNWRAPVPEDDVPDPLPQAPEDPSVSWEDPPAAPVDEDLAVGGTRPLTPESLKQEPPNDESLKASKKKKKKNKKKAASANDPDTGTMPTIDNVLGDAPAEPADAEMSGLPELVAAEPEPEPVPVNYTTLSLHGAVYNLSKKLGSPFLSSLALSKFRKTALERREAPEFLEVTRDVYCTKSVTPNGKEDRSLKDIIVGILFDHQTLLDRDETQDAIKDLSLGFDLLMKMRQTKASNDYGWN